MNFSVEVWFSSAKLAHQKSKPVMLLSQVTLAGNACHRDRHELFKCNSCNSFYACFCDEIFHKCTTQSISVSVPRVEFNFNAG